MSSKGWKRYVFSDFVNINPSVRLEASKYYSFVEMKDLNEKSKFVYPSAKRKLTGGSRFQNYDTLFARITPCLENGKICQVKELENGVGFGSTEFLVFRGREGISDNNFVFYLMRYDEVRRFAEQNMLGTSGRQRVTWNAFVNLKLDLPPLPTQRRIASILSGLDNKIELNRQTNATLEAMAQAIFKEWFVDFRFPGATGEMVESELGMIPKGWKKSNIFEIADLIGGGTPTTTNPDYWNGNIFWVSAKDVSNAKGLFLLQTEKTITESGVKNSSTRILPAKTTIITARGTVRLTTIRNTHR
jgi:type I restriction enzyme S subunit